MLLGGDIPEIVDYIDTKTLRVYAPTSAVFVCGGRIDITAPLPASLRDAFLKAQASKPICDYKVILAEELNAFFPRGSYKDILSFEADIAQISELIVLFSESFGSVAELGAFSMVEEIAFRLLVVIDDKNYNDLSFITLGPIRALENTYGGSAVCVLNRIDINIKSISNVSSLNTVVFAERLKSAIGARKSTSPDHSTFNQDRNGHLIKLIVGMIQHYGSLTVDEIDVLLYCFDLKVKYQNISDLLLCAEFFRWIIRDKRGVETYYSALNNREAIGYKRRSEGPSIDKTRWRADVVEYWRRSDPDRFSSIRDAKLILS